MSVTFRIDGLDEPELHVSNTNAADLLDHLGFDTEELMGGATPESVLFAISLHGDLGAKRTVVSGNIIWTGREEDRGVRYSSKLAEIATEAGRLGRLVVWS